MKKAAEYQNETVAELLELINGNPDSGQQAGKENECESRIKVSGSKKQDSSMDL